MAPLPHLRGETPESLTRLFAARGLDLLSARRVTARVVHQDRDDLADVPGLRREARLALGSEARLGRLELVERRRSRVDPFLKYLFRAADGALIEAVRIPLDKPRYSVCVSSQAGCAFACVFCATGRLGLSRHLEPWEMVEQVLAVRREATDRPVTGVVFQGQGEPFHNYEAVLRAAEVLRHPAGGRIGSDRITISTVGIPALIDRYTDEGHPYRVILSLGSAIAERRARLLPVAGRHDLGDLAAAFLRLANSRRSPVHLGWVLIAGVNTGPEEAEALRRLFPGVALRVSVIDVNDPDGRLEPPGDEERSRFLNALGERGIAFVRRYSGGPDIRASCGLLAAERLGGEVLA